MSTVDLYTSLDGLWETFQENHRKHNEKVIRQLHRELENL